MFAFRAVLGLAAFVGVLQGAIVEQRIAPAEGASFILYVEKTGLMSGRKHVLVFDRYDGVVRYDPDNPANSQVRLEVDAASVRVTDDWVSDKDRRKILDFTLKDMLDASRHPKLTFVSNGASSAGEKVKLTGNLTVRGITKPAEVYVSVKRSGEGEMWYEGSSTIRIRDYGLKPPSAALGVIGTRNEMELRFLVRAAPR